VKKTLNIKGHSTNHIAKSSRQVHADGNKCFSKKQKAKTNANANIIIKKVFKGQIDDNGASNGTKSNSGKNCH